MSFEVEIEEFSPKNNLISGCLAALISTVITYPLDFIKTRLSVERSTYKNVSDAYFHIVSLESGYGLYKGISPAILRQLTHAATRIAIYSTLEEYYYLKYKEDPTLLYEFYIACISGCASSLTGTPAEVIMNRMVADGLLRKCERRNYRGLFHAFKKIITEEGFLTLWRGSKLGAIRATLITLTQLTTYHSTKMLTTQKIDKLDKDDNLVSVCCGLASGLFTSIITSPFDIAKIRLQNMKVTNGKPQYTGFFDVLIKLLNREGYRTLTKGFLADYIKMGPYTVLFLMTFDHISDYFKSILKEKKRKLDEAKRKLDEATKKLKEKKKFRFK